MDDENSNLYSNVSKRYSKLHKNAGFPGSKVTIERVAENYRQLRNPSLEIASKRKEIDIANGGYDTAPSF